MRALAAQIVRLLNVVAFSSPSWCDNVRLLDSTPLPCGQSRETVKRSQFAGHAAYGYCASHSRYFWGFRLYLLCASDGMPIAFELAAANVPEREVAAEMLARVDLHGYTVIADKGFAGADFEALMAEFGAIFRRPDRTGEEPRFGGLGAIRQWIESVFDTFKGQLCSRNAPASMRTLLAVHNSGDSRSPRASPTTSALRSFSSVASVSVSAGRPPPGSRTRPSPGV
jgi:hypothetical protein